MSRIRSVKPEWLDDELLALATADARVLSVALMLLADDYGNGRANATMLAGRVFPGKVLETLEKALEELATIRYVLLYEVDGQRYFSIRNWSKHQKVDKPGKPMVPGPGSQGAEKQAVYTRLDNIRETPGKVIEEEENLRASRGSRSLPSPDPEEPDQPDRLEPTPGSAGESKIPPTSGDAFLNSFRKQPTWKRPDVIELHADWRKHFGRDGHRLVVNGDTSDAETLAGCIDANGLPDCKLVGRYAKFDGMVSGRDDNKVKHESIRYIFGNNDAFSRILRDAKKRESERGPGSGLARQRALKERDAGGDT